jgi:hypothetical protein
LEILTNEVIVGDDEVSASNAADRTTPENPAFLRKAHDAMHPTQEPMSCSPNLVKRLFGSEHTVDLVRRKRLKTALKNHR